MPRFSPQDERPFARLIRTAHRRRVAWRIAEFAWVGASTGGVLWCCVSLFTLNDSLEPITSTSLAIGSGAAIGIIVALTRGLPSYLNTTAALDEQLNTADLFATASRLRCDLISDCAMNDSLLAHADAFANGVSLNSLTLQRMGIRAWGGMILLTGCMLLASLLHPRTGQANGSSSFDGLSAPPADPLATVEVMRESTIAANQNEVKSRPPESGDLSTGGDRMGRAISQVNATNETHRGAKALTAATGDGRAETSASQERQATQKEPAQSNEKAHTDDANGIAASGHVGPSSNGELDHANIAVSRDGIVTRGPIEQSIASADSNASPLKSSDVKNDSPVIDSVPAGYRDLVRSFFESK